MHKFRLLFAVVTHVCLLCSYYINPLAWTLYGIIVTQLGDETDVVSTLTCILKQALHSA